MRRPIPALALVALLALLAVPGLAGAADQNVSIANFAFAPSNVTVEVGDTVTWRWDGPDTNHTVTSTSGQAESFESHPSSTPTFGHPVGSTFSHTFTQEGTFTYFCRIHPSSMRARVTVTAVGGAPPPPPADTTAPRISSFRARPARFCKRHRRCRRPGTRLTFSLNEAADVNVRAVGRSRSRRRVVKTFVLGRGRRGRNSKRFSAARLPEGSYVLTLTATDDAGNSRRARTRIRIVPPPRRR